MAPGMFICWSSTHNTILHNSPGLQLKQAGSLRYTATDFHPTSYGQLWYAAITLEPDDQ